MRLSNGYVTGVVDDSLVAAKRIRLSEKSRRASRHIRICLVIAEAREQRVRAGEVLVHADVELRFVQRAHWFALEVVSVYAVARSRRGIERNHLPADGVK